MTQVAKQEKRPTSLSPDAPRRDVGLCRVRRESGRLPEQMRSHFAERQMTDRIFVDRIPYKQRDCIPLLGLQRPYRLLQFGKNPGAGGFELLFRDEVPCEKAIEAVQAGGDAATLEGRGKR